MSRFRGAQGHGAQQRARAARRAAAAERADQATPERTAAFRRMRAHVRSQLTESELDKLRTAFAPRRTP